MKKTNALLAVAVTVSTFAVFAGTSVTTAHADTSKLSGTWSGVKNSLRISPSLTGDILFGYNNGCNYGEFSHTAIASEGSTYSGTTWDGHVVESTNVGTAAGANSVYTSHWQSHFLNYDAASLDYLSKSGYTFNTSSIVSKANAYSGTYDWASSYSDNNSWYCSKLVSRAVYDYNGYDLGFLVWGSFIAPADIYYDSAVVERNYATSSKYDGYSNWASGAHSNVVAPTTNNALTYDGVKVHATALTPDVKKAVDDRVKAEKAAGKSDASFEITVPTQKEGLKKYLKNLISQGKETKAQVEQKWNVTDAFLQ